MNTRKCKHCEKEFNIQDRPHGWMANHSRWCQDNPKIIQYKINSLKCIEAMNAARKSSGKLNQYSKAKLENKPVPESPLKGKSTCGRPHSEETKKLIREKALASSHRRLKKNATVYKGVLLDSTWEVELAKRLDSQGISWIRPSPIKWIDEDGITHNYFPDFYLPDYDLFLDPKNPHAIRVQKKKLDCLLTQHTNVVIIDSLDKCKTYCL